MSYFNYYANYSNHYKQVFEKNKIFVILKKKSIAGIISKYWKTRRRLPQIT